MGQLEIARGWMEWELVVAVRDVVAADVFVLLKLGMAIYLIFFLPPFLRIPSPLFHVLLSVIAFSSMPPRTILTFFLPVSC